MERLFIQINNKECSKAGIEAAKPENQVGTTYHRIATIIGNDRKKKKFAKMTRNTKGILLMLNDSYLVLVKFLRMSANFRILQFLEL